jgi:hypothetical protein
VTLDTILAAFAEGATAEEIAQEYPSVSLADVYQVIAYSLRHTSEVEAYLARRRQEIREARVANESKCRRTVSVIDCSPGGSSVALAGRRNFNYDILRALFRRMVAM